MSSPPALDRQGAAALGLYTLLATMVTALTLLAQSEPTFKTIAIAVTGWAAVIYVIVRMNQEPPEEVGSN